MVPNKRAETIPQQGETQKRSPREPHERDESASSQSANEPSNERVGRAAQADVEQGRVDTDKGPALGEAYDKQRAGTPVPDKRLRR